VLVNIVDGADVRMVQRGSGARLALEALHRLPVLRVFLRQEFQRHVAAELGVLGFVHHTHATAAELFEHAIMRNSLSQHSS
jgi:hypothetical protein